MKFSKRDKVIFYLIFFILALIIGSWIYEGILKFMKLNDEFKSSIIISIFLSTFIILAITIIHRLIFNEFIKAYLDISTAKENFKENFPYIYKFLFNKVTKYILKIFFIYIIWNYSLYIKNLHESMIIIFIIFLPSIFNKNRFQIPIKNIIEVLFLAIFIYIFSLFLVKEPQIKITFCKIYLNNNKPFETILSFIRAIFHFEFYISFLKILHIIINLLSQKNIVKKN